MRRFQSLALCAVMLLLCLPAHSQGFPDDDLGDMMPTMTPRIGRTQVYLSVRGVVRSFGDNLPLTDVRVDLRSVTGQLSASTYTNKNGTFGFNNLSRGSDLLEVRHIGYQTYTERVDLDNAPAFGIQAVLRKIAVGDNPPPGSGYTVSARELAIPNKALEAMDKGRQLLYVKSDYPGSIREFHQAIQAYPNYYEAYAEIGIAYMEMHDNLQAETALRKSLDLSDQKYLVACALLANLLSDDRRFTDAELVARKAVDLDANSWQANAQLGRALLGLDRAAEAEKSVQAAVNLKPDQANLYLLLTNIHLRQLNYQATLNDMDMYLKLAPDGTAAEQVRSMREKVQQALANRQPSQPQSPVPEPKPLRPPRE